jgi:hypothetical protein
VIAATLEGSCIGDHNITRVGARARSGFQLSSHTDDRQNGGPKDRLKGEAVNVGLPCGNQEAPFRGRLRRRA